MTSIVQYPDTPCSYPTVAGANVTTGIGNTPKILAVFRNQSTIENLRGVMQRFSFLPFTPSADTLVTLQLVGGVTSTGGTWSPVGGLSMFDVNTTATGYTGGILGFTLYSGAHSDHGNTPADASISALDAEELGLVLPIGFEFAVIASTTTTSATVSAAWSVNWSERS